MGKCFAMKTAKGLSYPLGATVEEDGVNFSLYAFGATHVELLFFASADDGEPTHVFKLEPRINSTFYYWHIKVIGAAPGQLYGFRVDGIEGDLSQYRFDPEKLLLDPYARIIVLPRQYSRQKAKLPGNNLAFAPKCMVADPKPYNWEGDKPIIRLFNRTYIYELHVRGFTRDESSGVTPALRGTFAGLIEKIPYLQSLGINAVELLPVQQFDPQDAPQGLTNYWGYSPMGFFAPHGGYCASENPLDWPNEFRDMVKALHKAGIEVIMDVVFNHTSENGNDGPIQCFKGLANSIYYITRPGGEYLNFSGCGNSINANNSVVMRLILDCLRYWVAEMHVDGFRFDLASSLSRDENGNPLQNPPILWAIESDPVLAGTKIIAEAWDAGGLYQMGRFVGYKWAEWNDRFRDDWRMFWRGDYGMVPAIQQRLTGSRDIFGTINRIPIRSVNFITCHDGFTLYDLVSYSQKYNYANGEHNRDGNNQNYSWNCGVEGETQDPDVLRLRKQQAKNFFASLILSQGTPMILMGDEFLRTQKGNNNAYCQDNPISWVDWTACERNADVLRFFRMVIAFAKNRQAFSTERYWEVAPRGSRPYIIWHGTEVSRPDTAWHSRSIVLQIIDPLDQKTYLLILNAFNEDLVFELPQHVDWMRIIDTSQLSPLDFLEQPEPVLQSHYLSRPFSFVLLEAKL